MSKRHTSMSSHLHPTFFALLTLSCLLLLILQATLATPVPGGSVAPTSADTTNGTTTQTTSGNILDIREWPYLFGGGGLIIVCLIFVCCCIKLLKEACYCIIILAILAIAGIALLGTGIFNHMHPPTISNVNL